VNHFTPGSTIFVSIPNNGREVSQQSSDPGNLQMVDHALQNINDETKWQVLIFESDKTDENIENNPVLHQSYIIFLWSQREGDINDILKQHVELMKNSPSWNPRGKFLVVVIGQNGSPRILASNICSVLWSAGKIVNAMLLIPNTNLVPPLVRTPEERAPIQTLDLYTWFPYKPGKCDEATDVTLVDQWIVEHRGGFRSNAVLFPAKIPVNFFGCPIRVSTLGVPPFVTLTDTYKREDGKTAYKVRGFLVEFILVSIQQMNLTPVFLSTEASFSVDVYTREITNVMDGVADISVGVIAIAPFMAFPGLGHTIPYSFSEIKVFIPCPARVHTIHNIMSMFTWTVWLVLAIVLTISGVVFWCSRNTPSTQPPYTNTSLSLALYNAWAILMGVSVSKMPKSWNERLFLLSYVLYCFAIITVFQAFFVSYLVEPGYEKRINTFDDVIHSGLLYGFNYASEFIAMTMDFTKQNNFTEDRRVDCVHLQQCMERMMIRRDIATVNGPMYANYIANTLGAQDASHVVCSVEENVFYVNIAALISKGSPFLDGLNSFLRRCLEGGLVDRYWAEINLSARLRSKHKALEESSDFYFVFSVSHLRTAFALLVLGCALSLLVFTCEIICKLPCTCRR
jgi:hypothetical protein